MSSYQCSTRGAGDGDTGNAGDGKSSSTGKVPTERSVASTGVSSRRIAEFLRELRMLEKMSKEVQARDQKHFDTITLLEAEFDAREKEDGWHPELLKSLDEAKAVLKAEYDGPMSNMGEILKESVRDSYGRLPVLREFSTHHAETKEIDPETGEPVKFEIVDWAAKAKSINSYSVGYPRKTGDKRERE